MQHDARDDLRYCRDVESYLCRRNGGHLIRIVGPSFALVQGWAEEGIPLTIVERAIDICSERREARRDVSRPLRIEFCEAEVREQFQRWRKAVGPYVGGQWAMEPATGGPRANGSDQEMEGREAQADARSVRLSSHLTRASERLARAAARLEHSDAFRDRLDTILVELDGIRQQSKGARGERRTALLDALSTLDARLMEAAREEAARTGLEDELRAAAAKELASWRERMPAGAWHGAIAAGAGRLLRDRLDLPDLTL